VEDTRCLPSARGILNDILGCILQAILLLCGVHSVLGLRNDTWRCNFRP